MENYILTFNTILFCCLVVSFLIYKKCFVLPPIALNLVVKEKEIIDWLSERKLMPSPELITHISNHPDGLVLLEKSVASLDGPKLFLSVSDLLIEDNPEPPKPISRPKVADIPPIIIEIVSPLKLPSMEQDKLNLDTIVMVSCLISSMLGISVSKEKLDVECSVCALEQMELAFVNDQLLAEIILKLRTKGVLP